MRYVVLEEALCIPELEHHQPLPWTSLRMNEKLLQDWVRRLPDFTDYL
ncbi:hypothetical protein [Streptomyces sp. NPDC056165]